MGYNPPQPSETEQPIASKLTITIQKTQDWQRQADGRLLDFSGNDWSGNPNQATIWIAGGLKTIFGANSSQLASATTTTGSYPYSTTTNNNLVELKLEENVSFLAKIFGGRNDLGGEGGDNSTKNNQVTVNLSKGSNFYLKIAYGGRSAQLDKVTGTVHKGFETNSNTVKFSGVLKDSSGNDKKAVDFSNGDSGQSSLLVMKGIFGGEGFESSNNIVSISDSLVAAGFSGARKLGIVGGRGTYYFRINDSGNLPIVKQDSNGNIVWENKNKLLPKLKGNQVNTDLVSGDYSSLANGNIVTIDNSYIGFVEKDKVVDGKTINRNDWTYTDTEKGISVYGGWAIGEAKNNIIAVSNSVINGNLIGGLEMKDQLRSDSKNTLRPLDANLVSLFNTKLEQGSSIYGTSTADAYAEAGTGVIRVAEGTLKTVNRRRGGAYIAGENIADAAYVKYIHFGEYFDTNEIKKDTKATEDVTRKYYPGLNSQTTADPDSLVRITSNSTEKEGAAYKMQLGDLVARSYLVNRKGFHSSLSNLSVTGEELGNVSDVTNGKHNFWVGMYANLVKGVDGDGALFDPHKDLFVNKEKYEVRHSYGDGKESKDQNLSLLVHDDGMVYSYKEKSDTASSPNDENSEHRPALMHNFRYHYDGLVLYVGANPGQITITDDKGVQKIVPINAVQISFSEIEKFREANDPTIDSFGNTFVGVFLEGNANPFYKGSSKEGFNSLDVSEMTFEPMGESGEAPFEITQNERVVAKATYAFYKYMHFDGKDASWNNSLVPDKEELIAGKQTGLSDSGGVGLKYWLKSVDILDGETLTLNGATSNSVLGATSNIRQQERFTLSAKLIGKGNVRVADGTSVVIGSPQTIYTIDVDESDAAAKVVNFKTQEANTFTGLTIVGSQGTLVAGINGALGSDESHTSSLQLEKESSFYLQNHKQDIGHLDVAEGAKLNLSGAPEFQNIKDVNATFTYEPDLGDLGVLVVHNTYKPNGEKLASNIVGNIEGAEDSKLLIDTGRANISSANENFSGTFELRRADGYLYNSNALQKAKAIVSQGSALYFHNAEELASTRSADPRSNAYVGAIQNAGQIFLSGGKEEVSALNHVNVENDYAGEKGSVLHYRGLVQGPNNSYVDVVHSKIASGTSTVSFGEDHSKIPVSGIFAEARGEKTIKTEGIPIFVIADKGSGNGQLQLEMEPFGVVAKDDEAYKWVYHLGYNDEENGTERTWVLYNSDDKDHYEPLVPPKEENLVLRPEAGAYVGASQSWAKMHMRLHDRFGQAYYIDPFDGEEKPAAAWVRQVGSHSHFRMGGGQSKTHSNTAVTQIGGDLLRNEFNEDWKYIGGVFAGGLYNRSDSRSWDSAKSRSDGYSLGIYGTLYTGNSPDDGFYVDSWLLFGRYDNKIWSDEISSFKFKSHGWVWSVETGYTIPLGESGTKDYNKLIWTFQPEAQLVWDGVKANSAKDPTGTKYRQLGTDNVTLRVGARLHANYMNKGLGFIEGNWIHNTKKAGVQMGTDKVYMDGGRNLGEFRMGLEGHLSRNTLGWATVGVQAGKSGYHNETAQIGIKYMF